MKLTQDVRDMPEVDAGMAEKAAEFRAAGGELYVLATETAQTSPPE